MLDRKRENTPFVFPLWFPITTLVAQTIFYLPPLLKERKITSDKDTNKRS